MGDSWASLGLSWAPLGRFLGVQRRSFSKNGSKIGSKRLLGWILDRFGEGLGLIFHTFLSICLSFLLDFWISFPIVLRYMFALILVPCSFNAEANNE